MITGNETARWSKDVFSDKDYVSATRREQILEACTRLEFLTRNMGLDPIVLEGWKMGELYYSCQEDLTVAPVRENDAYVRIIQDFETQFNYLAYHAIRTQHCLVILFVSNAHTSWWGEFPNEERMAVFVECLNEPGVHDFGLVMLDVEEGAMLCFNRISPSDYCN